MKCESESGGILECSDTGMLECWSVSGGVLDYREMECCFVSGSILEGWSVGGGLTGVYRQVLEYCSCTGVLVHKYWTVTILVYYSVNSAYHTR